MKDTPEFNVHQLIIQNSYSKNEVTTLIFDILPLRVCCAVNPIHELGFYLI